MELNILPILHYEGKKISFSEAISVAPREGDGFSILGPVSLTGSVTNIGGCLELEAEGKAKLLLLCDRCTEEFEEEFSFQVSEQFKKAELSDGGAQNPDLILLQGDAIDLESAAYDALVLQLPFKVLCKEDCKGLCMTCGQNLNVGSCSCETETTDPRFDVLDQLL